MHAGLPEQLLLFKTGSMAGFLKDRKVNRHMKHTTLLSKSITKQSLQALLCQHSLNSRLLIINTENVLIFCYCTAINTVLSEEWFCATSDYPFNPNYPHQYSVPDLYFNFLPTIDSYRQA